MEIELELIKYLLISDRSRSGKRNSLSILQFSDQPHIFDGINKRKRKLFRD